MAEPAGACVILVMGVSGAGKTTIGRHLAAALGWAFEDADALHSPANIAKMAAGMPLDDLDRAPWLEVLRAWVATRLQAGERGVLAASLLKRRYRDRVIGGQAAVRLVYLHATADLLGARMRARGGHFMPPELLASQLAALEPPAPEEAAIRVDVSQKLCDIMEEIRRSLACGNSP